MKGARVLHNVSKYVKGLWAIEGSLVYFSQGNLKIKIITFLSLQIKVYKFRLPKINNSKYYTNLIMKSRNSQLKYYFCKCNNFISKIYL